MSTVTETDLGPLIWVKGEVDASLARAAEALGKFVAAPTEIDNLKFAKSHLHQAYGALSIVGLDGVTQFTDTVELLLADIEKGNLAPSHTVLDLAHNAIMALRHYLDELVNGAAHQPLKLWPLYEKLQAARRLPQFSAADLFFPDLSARPPRRTGEPQVAAAEVPRLLREARSRFERGFLRWLRSGSSGEGAEDMREAVVALERVQTSSGARAFWWATQALADVLVVRAATADLPVRRLWGRIGTQLRRAAAGSRTIAERLSRDVLYHIAIAPPATESLRQAKQVWQLDALVPRSGAAVDIAPLKPVLRGLKETVQAAKEAWNRFCAGAAVGLPQFSEHVAAIAQRTDGLPEPALVRIATAVNATAQWLRKAPLQHNETVAMEVATALLLVETAIETFEELDPDYARQADVMVERLDMLRAGHQPAALETPLLGEMSRRAQEKLFMSQVVREILNNLAVVEQTLDGYFRDPSRSGELATLGKPVKQIEGALAILGQEKALALLRECEDSIARLLSAQSAPEQADFESLAHKLSGLGFFVDALQHGPADLDAILYPERKAKVAAETLEDEPAATVESELQQRMASAQGLVEALRQQPDNTELRTRLKSSLETIREEASLVDDARIEAQAREALEALRREPEGQQAPVVADLIPAAAAPVQPPAAIIDQSQEEVDAELLSIFIEEAAEVLDSISQHLGMSRGEPHNQEVLTTIRRGFHTLKGSGRMVGLKDLGEAAWAAEQVMNRWLQREEDATPALHEMIDSAYTLFSAWVDQLKSGGSTHRDSQSLIAICQALKSETPAETARALPAAPAPQPPEALEVEAIEVPVLEPLEAIEAEDLEASGLETVVLPQADTGHGAMPEAETLILGGAFESAVPEDEDVTIGGLTLARKIYDMYLAEARQHLAVLRRELARLQVNPAVLPAEGTIRAAHTLAGISGTVGFVAIHDLARSLENAMGRMAAVGLPASDEDSELLNRAASVLDGMLNAVQAERMPVAVEDLVDQLERLAPHSAPEPFPLDLEVGDLGGVGTEAMSQAGDELPGLAELEQVPTVEPVPVSTLVPAGAAQLAGAAPMLEELEALEADVDLPPQGADVEEAAQALPISTEFATAAVVERVPASPIELLSGAQPEAIEQLEALEPPRTHDDFQAAVADESPLPLELPTGSATAPELAVASSSEQEIVLESPLDLDFGAPGEAPTRSEFDVASIPPEERLEVVKLAVADQDLPVAEFVLPQAEPTGLWPEPTPVDLMLAQTSPANLEPAARADAAEPAAADAAEKRKLRLQDEIDESLLPIFLEEAQDLMRDINERVRNWHEAPADSEIARGLKRLLHTLKGSARMAGAMGLGELVHSMETRVEDAAEGSMPAHFFDDLNGSLDRCAFLLDRLQSGTWTEPLPVSPEAEAQAGEPVPAMPEPARPQAAPAAAAVPRSEGDATQMLRVRANLVDRFVNEAGEMAIARSRIEGEMRTLRHSLLDLTDNVIRLRAQLRELEIQAESQMQSRMAQAGSTHADFDPLEIDRFTRLQELTRMIAESVNDVSTVQHNVLRNLDQADSALASQGRLNRDLQQALMSVRMVPFNTVADRLHRVVRQTAKELGKKATLDIRGGQIELDRGVLDQMVGPLEHLLRNAVSHGVESPERRSAAGKSDIGQITAGLVQEGNEVAISISDDGHGLDYAGIRNKALANGLIDANASASDAELADLIFAPGFSTAQEVSAISGRGVGMDVVKSAAVALGGRVDISSASGRGTTFQVHLPLTLAVLQALLVRAGGRTYAIPSTMIEQVMELKPERLDEIRSQGGTDWLGNHYPYRYLPRLLGDRVSQAPPSRFRWVLLAHAGSQRVAVQVDELRGNQEVVVKKTGAQLARVVGVAGATVLGDGEIVLILNPIALASREARHHQTEILPSVPEAIEPLVADTRPTIMVVDDSLTVRKITGRLLEREGYRVVTAKDGVDALEQLIDELPAVMLVDIEMPRMDGFDLTRNVRGDQRLKRVPIVMITSRIADKHRSYAHEIGVNHYLGKPYNEEELLGIIAGYTRNAEAIH